MEYQTQTRRRYPFNQEVIIGSTCKLLRFIPHSLAVCNGGLYKKYKIGIDFFFFSMSRSILFLCCIIMYILLTQLKLESEYEICGNPEMDVPIEDTWRAMEQCVKLGYAKSIGVSNFNSVQIERVLQIAEIKPVVNQVKKTNSNNIFIFNPKLFMVYFYETNSST